MLTVFFFDECKMVEMRRLAFLCKSNPRPVHNVTTFFTPELAREIGLDNARLLHDAVSIPAWSIDWVLNTCAQNNEVLSRRQRRIKGTDDDNSCDLFVAHEEFFFGFFLPNCFLCGTKYTSLINCTSFFTYTSSFSHHHHQKYFVTTLL